MFLPGFNGYIHTYIHTYIHAYILTWLCTYQPSCLKCLHTVSMYACIHTDLNVYIPAIMFLPGFSGYIHAYIHTYIHTCIHTDLTVYIPTIMFEMFTYQQLTYHPSCSCLTSRCTYLCHIIIHTMSHHHTYYVTYILCSLHVPAWLQDAHTYHAPALQRRGSRG
jgi:hypothetical protein